METVSRYNIYNGSVPLLCQGPLVQWIHNYVQDCLVWIIVWFGHVGSGVVSLYLIIELLFFSQSKIVWPLKQSEHYRGGGWVVERPMFWSVQFSPSFQLRHVSQPADQGHDASNILRRGEDRLETKYELLRALLSLCSAGGEELSGQSRWRRQWSGKWLVGPF